MNQKQTYSVRLDGDDIETKRREVRSYFHQSYDLFESLFELLKSDKVYYLQSEPTRHPMIFYFGHTAIFYINKLVASGALKERINPHFEELFAVGVDEMTWDASSDSFRWPSVDAVREYRNRVRELVDSMITSLPMNLPITQADPFWAIWMGIEHERIHIETSSVLHRQMPLEHIRESEKFPMCPVAGDALENGLVIFKPQTIRLGKGDGDNGRYGWDNEYGEQSYEVGPFQASKYLVSNGEFMDFVVAKGYETSRWWDEEGLKFLEIRSAICPPFWIPQEDGSYKFRTLSSEIEMPYNWPVEVNALEAEAFCRWKSVQEGIVYRLPSEAEYAVLVEVCEVDEAVFDDTHSNLNFAHYASSVPVDTYAHGKLYDVIGNVWQWTQTQMAPFEGFFTHPWYADFTEPTFDGKHNMIKGGSWASTGNEILKSSRYAFRRHFTQHAGFRYVVGEGENESKKYENIAQMFDGWKKRYG
ncbi:MAG: 5-histidylcysteine sulfoxide synthase [Sulfuricurvum sp.]|uniref:5-histidylcysteine sulfoxide synthase n=1 Tax=Sulfuricurvum sp. TaxID=2025608 RepID=UPI0026180086|nr:5-histidylcysteine sulfoxide synthase [Sulfuricurvum sp.]MDD2829740.1 5-histidylcysteine sulfoxide synthase [Sulfuricurvum sp.]MDD4948508.1 5-histidylcysteine sulfoxide synthase [Sulfuricurvum sp.]